MDEQNADCETAMGSLLWLRLLQNDILPASGGRSGPASGPATERP